MSRTFCAIAVLAVCSCGAPAKPAPTTDAPDTTAKAEPAKAEPATMPAKAEPAKIDPAEPPKGDPVLLKVCKAFDEVSAEQHDAPQLMARAAVRATELGVTEAQIETLGPQPPQLLASIRARGNPPECAAFVAYLETLP